MIHELCAISFNLYTVYVEKNPTAGLRSRSGFCRVVEPGDSIGLGGGGGALTMILCSH